MKDDPTNDEPLLATVPVAGKVAGMEYQQAYRAAKAGVMPTIKIGRKMWVQMKKWRAICNGEVEP
jgi:hypothetical protein